jgi:hypothetical protein
VVNTSIFRKLLQSCRNQLLPNRFFLVFNGLFVLLFLALTIYVRYTERGSGNRVQVVSRLFRDPFNFNYPYLGLLTSLSEVLWCISASICLFSFSFTKVMGLRQKNNWFLLFSAIGLIILLVDDIFRLTLMVQVYLGIPKLVMYMAYGIFFISYAFLFSRKILSTPYILLLISLFLFIASGITDMIHIEGRGLPIILEDGAKLLGLVNLALYFWWVCQHEILNSIQHKLNKNF